MRRFLDISLRTVLLAATVVLVVLVVWRTQFGTGAEVSNFAHAGGMIGGRDYTNSLAAFDRSYGRGFRFLEVDFSKTSDGRVVCSHDWDAFGGKAPTLDAFLSWRAGIEYPPCTLPELKTWLGEHPDVTLVSDAKDDVIAINTELHVLAGDRLVVQAYSSDQVCAFWKAKLKRVIFTFYRLSDSSAVFREEMSNPCLSEGRIEALTLPIERFLKGIGYVARNHFDGPVFAHTVNSCPSYILGWLLGADAIYTDTLADGDCLVM